GGRGTGISSVSPRRQHGSETGRRGRWDLRDGRWRPREPGRGAGLGDAVDVDHYAPGGHVGVTGDLVEGQHGGDASVGAVEHSHPVVTGTGGEGGGELRP